MLEWETTGNHDFKSQELGFWPTKIKICMILYVACVTRNGRKFVFNKEQNWNLINQEMS